MSQYSRLIRSWNPFFIYFIILEILPTAAPQPILSKKMKTTGNSINYENLQGPIGAGDGESSYASLLLILQNRKSQENKDNIDLTNDKCRNIALSGSSAFQKSTKGTYIEGGIHNNRHFYIKKGEDQIGIKFLYWDKDYQRWCVSSVLGSKVVNLRSADNSKLPNEIMRFWESWNGEKGQFVLENQIRTFCTSQCSCENGIPESSCFIIGAPKCKSCHKGFHLKDFDCIDDSFVTQKLVTFKNDSIIGVEKTKSSKIISPKKITSNNMIDVKKVKSKNNIHFPPGAYDLTEPDENPEEDLPHRKNKRNIGTPSINTSWFLFSFFFAGLIDTWL